MEISKLSTRCLFLPPMFSEKALSVGDQERMKEQISEMFGKLHLQGIKLIVGIGGMDLNYRDYVVPPELNFVMAYHTPWLNLNYIGEIYESTNIHTIEEEFKSCKKQITFIDQLMLHDFRLKEIGLCNPREMEITYGNNWRNTAPINDSKCLVHGRQGEELLQKFVEIEKIIVGYNMKRHHNLFKSPYNKNKTGLKVDITKGGFDYQMHGNPVRENLIIKK